MERLINSSGDDALSDLSSLLEDSKGLPDVFEVVKKAVERTLGERRAGLMLGLADLPLPLGAFYVVGSNIIVMNQNLHNRIRVENPHMVNAFSFRILLHEYLHSLGYLNEVEVRRLVYEVSQSALGENHPATRISWRRIQYFLPHTHFMPRRSRRGRRRLSDLEITVVKGFDRSSTGYIA